jgi:hypothetical protein
LSSIHVHNVAPSNYAWGIFYLCVDALEVDRRSINLFANPKIHAAYATFHCGKAAVVYNPEYFSRLELASRRGWGCAYILAHEVGHHMWQRKQPDGRWGTGDWECELAADYYAGVAMARMGAGGDDLDDFHYWSFSQNGCETHPDSVLRLRAIRRGWVDGGGKGEIETDVDRLYEIFWERMTRWWPDKHPQHPKLRKQ